jgi:hypothetical protein
MSKAQGIAQSANQGNFKNRIINGAMMIDQRNAGASVTPTSGTYTLDRWRAILSTASKYSIQQSSVAPSGFSNSALLTSLSAYSLGSTDYFGLQQKIEGFNTADLAWGTASASPVTLSFWVRSSLTGTFGGSLQNSAQDRSYPFSYTISAANTWEQKSVTVTGDTTGTWVGATNGTGLMLNLAIGVGTTYSGTAGSWSGSLLFSATGATSVVGTNGATFYITGVQLEKGSTATSFDYRPYGSELALCQRYYYKNIAGSGAPFGSGFCNGTTSGQAAIPFPVPMRTAPTSLETTGTASNYRVISPSVVTCNSVPTIDDTGAFASRVAFPVASGLTSGNGCFVAASSSNIFLAWSAEL